MERDALKLNVMDVPLHHLTLAQVVTKTPLTLELIYCVFAISRNINFYQKLALTVKGNA